ncbi:MAG: 16S rRNA (guanine(527)-N(7))-methyltransferase RsmG [Spirochaetia bacterium]|jgi:16S rRNA (guanine527-N7)-methyltransferase|nr:16S rRNA (guanine(527)-N(7))-methyltransferase RsmG [Spirochaetia bacterium]
MKSSNGREALLRDCLLQLDIDLSDEQIDKLLRYVAEIELFNPVYKLVGASGDDLIIRHVVDSLAAYHQFTTLIKARPAATFCDVGSGAGLPGIPLAIVFPDNHFTLVERMGRRVGFLENELVLLGLRGHVEIFPHDLKQLKSRFDIVTFRAFHPLVAILDDIDAITDENSVVCAYKGKADTLDQELHDIDLKCAGKWNCSVEKLSVPYLEAERRLCVLTKQKLH